MKTWIILLIVVAGGFAIYLLKDYLKFLTDFILAISIFILFGIGIFYLKKYAEKDFTY